MTEHRALRFGAKSLRAVVASILLTLVQATTICASGLPRELDLQCKGDAKLFITRDNETESQKDAFHIALRLKDGSLSNIDYNFLEGGNCAVVDDVIRCELDTTAYNGALDTTNKEHRTVAISRVTGEMHLVFESQAFVGANAAGKPEAVIRSFRTGVCRAAAAGPLF